VQAIRGHREIRAPSTSARPCARFRVARRARRRSAPRSPCRRRTCARSRGLGDVLGRHVVQDRAVGVLGPAISSMPSRSAATSTAAAPRRGGAA
jgi:hypothetical protein